MRSRPATRRSASGPWKLKCHRIPRVAVFCISMNEYDHSPSSSPAHKDVHPFRAVNRFRLKSGGQGRLRATQSRRKGENCKGEAMSAHRSSLDERSGFDQRGIASLGGGVPLNAVELIAIGEGYEGRFRKGGA